jgi:hypothetical protein
MKTSYCLVTAAGVAAAALAVYTAQYPGWSGAQEVPPLPMRGANAAQPAQLGVADGGLPPIVMPPDAPLVIPAAGKSPELPIPPMTAEPTLALPPVPPTPLPKLPTVPAPPASPPAPGPLPIPALAPPTAPAVPPIVPVPPVESVKPAAPPALVPPVRPAEPATAPVKSEVPVAPAPTAVLPKPAPLPQPQPLPILPPPTKDQTPAAGPASGKFVVLKGDKLVEASVSVAGEKAILRQGSFERTLPKTDVLFVAETQDDVYRFMLAKVSASDVAARLGVARWCMFAGLREQALAEAKEVLKLQPANTAAADMARSLEESIKLFPADGSGPVVAAKPPGGVLVSEPEPDITPEGATAYVSRAQPVLANQCMECHARADHSGAFKLIRITGFEAGPQSTKANMRATATQVKKDDPLNSPLLTKALVAHGGMKQPAFVSRQAAAYRVLEAWVLLAAGPVVQPMNPPTQPMLPPATVTPTPVLPPVEPAVPPITPPTVVAPAPVVPTTPVVAVPPVAPPVDVPPAVSVAPVAPAIPRVEPPVITIPPVPPVITVPPLPPLPIEPVPSIRPPSAETRVPAVLPTPPSLPSADANPNLPKIPNFTPPPAPLAPIPPAASLPKPPGAVQNTGGIGAGGQFGTQAPPKPPAPTGPAGGDEFDPAAFNKSK